MPLQALQSVLLITLFSLAMPLRAALPVFVSIPPQAWLLKQLAGERLHVSTMLGPNANPHNYDPSPRQLAALADARVYFTIGIPFESMWQHRLKATNKNLEFVHCGSEGEHHDHHDHHDGKHSDPHIWTDPNEASAIAACMHEALVKLDPDGVSVYNANLQALQDRLQQLDQRIQRLLVDVSPRIILVQHPGWDYFASRYGFEQLAIEDEGHEPNARHLVKVIERARALNLKTIFIQQQYSPAAARLVADAIGARIVEVDPMAADYPDNLRHLAEVLAEQ